MEHVTENIYRWEGKIKRTDEERRLAHERAVADIELLIATDPYLRKVREQRDRNRAPKAKAEVAEA